MPSPAARPRQNRSGTGTSRNSQLTTRSVPGLTLVSRAWTGPEQLSTLITFESQADRIFDFEPLLVPGLLQTHAYMRAVMERGGVPEEDAELRVSVRAGRQTVLSRKHPPKFHAIIAEAVFRRPFGGPDVMSAQIRHIRAVAEQPNITVQVIPFSRGGYPIYGPYMFEFERE